jgi:hypothetical protein
MVLAAVESATLDKALMAVVAMVVVMATPVEAVAAAQMVAALTPLPAEAILVAAVVEALERVVLVAQATHLIKVLLVQSVFFTPVVLGLIHQQERVTNNEPIHRNRKRSTQKPSRI